MSTYLVSIEVDVHDEQALLKAARQRCKDDGLCDAPVFEDDDGNVIVTDCLIILLDPGQIEGGAGADIENTSAELVP